jgi:hypothetical protein
LRHVKSNYKLNRIGKTQLRLLDSQAVTVKIVEKSRKERIYQPCYDAAVADMLELLWKNFNRPWGKPFAPFLRLRENYRMSDMVTDKLKKISPRTIHRLLRKPKQRMKIRGTSGTRPVRLLYRAISILTWFQYAALPSGFFQIDLVQHDGGNPSGASIPTPAANFINRPVVQWCQRQGACSRGRPAHKTDNCYVKQKNYAAIRKIVGCFRYQGTAG